MASDFSSALTAWRELNLPSLQHDLTAQVNPIVEAQRHALLARKSLAERTREFRSIPEDPPTEKLGALKPLLKAYQSEIDALSKRSKNAENSLLQLHSTLESLPDPYPLLEVILDQTAALTELDSLKATNQRLQQDLQSVHLASEKTQNALTDRIRQLESSFDTRLADGITASQHELTAKYDERLRNAGHREDSLQQSLALAQDQIKELSSAAAAALQESSSSEEQEAQRKNDAAKLAQHDLITAELTRAQGRITTLERRNEELRAELESLRSGREHEDRLAELSSSLHEARTQSDSLREALSLQRARADTADEERKRKVEELGRKVDEAERVVGVMRKKLAGMADYEEVKRELSIIRSVEFAQYEDGDDLDPPTTSGADSPNPDDAEETTKTLESMLVQKNKKLQDDLTSERVRHNELKAVQAQLAAELEVAKGEVDRLKALNGRLEDDLLLLNVQGDGRGEGGKKVNEGKTQNGTAAASSSTADPSTDPFDILLNNPSTSTTTTTSTPNPQQQQQQQSSSSLLPIITSQRDRFRTRNAELEEELRTQFQTISSLRSEVKQLQTDNLGLYEKVRYLSSYNAAEGGGGGEGSRYPPPYQSAGQSRETRIVVDRSVGRGSAGAGGAGGEERYRDRYEESMDPFASFRGREQSRAFAALNPLERLLHMVTRVVLGHRRMRIAFTVYALGLHVLVLLILFEFEFGGRGTRTRTPSIGITPADQVRPPG